MAEFTIDVDTVRPTVSPNGTAVQETTLDFGSLEPTLACGENCLQFTIRRLLLPSGFDTASHGTAGIVLGLSKNGQPVGEAQTQLATLVAQNQMEWTNATVRFRLPADTQAKDLLLCLAVYTQPTPTSARHSLFWANAAVATPQGSLVTGVISLRMWEYLTFTSAMPNTTNSTFANPASICPILIVDMNSDPANRSVDELARAIFRNDPAAPSFDLTSHLTMVRDLNMRLGWNRRPVGVSFSDLSVTAQVGANDAVSTVASVFHSIVCPFPQKKVQTKLLDGVTGSVLPGEMLLVLGPPGSGCSNFIQALAGALPESFKVTGNIKYNGDPIDGYVTSIKLIGDEDTHIPALTVESTRCDSRRKCQCRWTSRTVKTLCKVSSTMCSTFSAYSTCARVWLAIRCCVV